MKKLLFILLLYVLYGCNTSTDDKNAKSFMATVEHPNIIVILFDDVGNEVPTYTGGRSYSTPNIDSLAAQGTVYTECHSLPLCSPSRQELLTGLYGFRNYKHWGKLDTSNITIANILKGLGYSTCIAGKWQLDGGDMAIHHFGFDSYSVWLPYATDDDAESNGGSHYKNPTYYQNATVITDTTGKYGEDIFREYLFNFIDTSTKPFFALWTMNLCHSPFQPTPDDTAFAAFKTGSNIKWFPNMVKYMDKEIGMLKAKIDSIPNTYVFLISDNGTDIHIYSNFNDTLLQGGKGSTGEDGTHVPMIMYKTSGGFHSVDSSLIDFTDFFPTLTHLAGATSVTTDGVDFLTGERTWIFQDFQYKGLDSPLFRHLRLAQTALYKKYDTTPCTPTNPRTGSFYKIYTDGTPDKKAIPTSLPQKKADTLLKSVIATMHN